MKINNRIIGVSPALIAILEQSSHLAAIDKPVLIIGERGTGKELIADRLHFLSNRWDCALIKINCAAISEQLLESELFGHEPGAFTGANRVHQGHFERAEGGTLFLDELGTLSLKLQEKILRVIEYGEFYRLGGQKTRKTNIRIVAATNKNLKQASEEKSFLPDLLDRLAFDVIHLPPLRYRKEDIPLLTEHYAITMVTELNWEFFPGFSHEAMRLLTNHKWPGNIRELKNVVERSVYRWQQPDLEIDHIILDPFDSPYLSANSKPINSIEELTDSSFEKKHPIKNLNSSELVKKGFQASVADFEISLVNQALIENQFNQKKSAEALAISYDQFRGLYKKYADKIMVEK